MGGTPSKPKVIVRGRHVFVILVILLEPATRGLSVGSGDVGLVVADETLAGASQLTTRVRWRGSRSQLTATGSVGTAAPAPDRQAGKVVWVLGDSFTFGWGSLEETVPAQLAALMPKGSAVYT